MSPDSTRGHVPAAIVHDWFAVKLTREAWIERAGEIVGTLTPLPWLEDTCAGGTYADEFGRSVWYDTAIEARDAMFGAELELREHTLVRLQVNPDGGNHYLMTDVAWP